MEYKKIELKEPIFELQEGEKPKQHYFIELYYEVDDENQIKFFKSFEGLDKGDKWVYSGCTAILRFKPYAPRSFENLFGMLQAKIRRDAYWDDTFKSDKATRKKKVNIFMNTFTDDLIDSTYDLKETEEEISYDESKAHLKAKGKSDVASARKSNWEILKDLGSIEDLPQTHKIEGSIDSNVDVRHHNVAEDIILNPAYAELTRKLLEDVTNEKGTDSK